MTDQPASERDLAQAAALQASEALTMLLRFVRDGEHSEHFAFEEETVELLADALKLAIAIENDPARRQRRIAEFGAPQNDEDSLLNQLAAALDRFLEGWAG